MKLTVGYDRDLAEQFFRRSLKDLSDWAFEDGAPVDEVEYLSRQFAATAVFNTTDRLGSPWRDEPTFLKEIALDHLPPEIFQFYEDRAAQILFQVGLLWRGLSSLTEPTIHFQRKRRSRTLMASQLYELAAKNPLLSEGQRRTLQGVGRKTRPWVQVLKLIPGSDYLELLGASSSRTIYLP